MKDALGNDVVLGDKYGYSTSSSGNAMVVVGIARKFTPQKVALEVTNRRFFLYAEETPTPTYRNCADVVHIASFHLFPV